jgi:hypothetical protein
LAAGRTHGLAIVKAPGSSITLRFVRADFPSYLFLREFHKTRTGLSPPQSRSLGSAWYAARNDRRTRVPIHYQHAQNV